MTPRIALQPARRWAHPGASLRVDVRVRGGRPGTASLRLALVDVDREVALVERRVRLRGEERRIRVSLRMPEAPRRGYAIQAALRDASGAAGSATEVVEALAGWWDAPRHVAWTDFRRDATARRQVTRATEWHATVAQAYDWMYRHYQYTASSESFLDALGRRVSHRAVAALVAEGHRAGIATLAYGSVYGAEPEYVAEHPDERVFDESGNPISLGGAFFINDVRAGRPWRARLLREYERACRAFGFDGIHMDTYGPPHEAWTADGERLLFVAEYPGLIEQASARVAATAAHRRVLFNCVEGFPLDAVARTPTAAHYLEVWPPDDRYRDLIDWIDRARAMGTGKAVVIAAYVPAMRVAHEDAAARARATETAVLLTTIIIAAGGFHHALAENDRLLVEGYYPAAVRLRAAEAAELRSAWRFSARYLHLLSDPAAHPVPIRGLALTDGDGRALPISNDAAAGSVWVRATETPSGSVYSLVDLRGQSDDRWTAARQPSVTNRGWCLAGIHANRALAMSPWSRNGSPSELATRPSGLGLPTFRRWLMVHVPEGG